ncbi:zinc carboxypeptidase domain-containing protein [Sarocladium implicatum]|nr:zinc carboxypeptidase domain-containing protein [Sarocladium implicatum]
MRVATRFAAAALALAPAISAKVSYEGYKTYQVTAHDDFEKVTKALAGLDVVDMSCESDHEHLDIAVAPKDLKAFEALGLDAKLVIEDLGAELEKETFQPYESTRLRARDGEALELPDLSYFESYHTLEEHHQFLEDVAATLPDNSEIFSAGDSLEGRPLKGIHLWGRDGPGKHEAIIWHGTVHAREWIVAPTLEYILYQLADGWHKRSCTSKRTLDNFDVYIMPIVNPDGFTYTLTNDRLWRKNRQEREGETCVGTDVNRNWPHFWDVPGGSSPDPCSQTYRGEEPGDTPEMAVLTNHTLSIAEAQGIKYYIDWHSYSQLILLPYGYSCTADAPNYEKQLELAGGVAEAIKSVNGLDFVYGQTCRTIYQTSGGSMDYVQDVAQAEFSWAFELRPNSAGAGGFAIPPENIIPSGEENWAGMKYVLARFASDL